MPGCLVVCPTPIGNLDDVTPRVREALVSADFIACEDTRQTGAPARPPADPAGIPGWSPSTRATKRARAVELAQRIERGDVVALVSDAGMPAISDPGYKLIRRCIDRDLEVTVLPGPSVVPVALVASGLPTDKWRFEGFLPRRAGEMERVLRSAETVVAFESPRRVGESLAALASLAPDREAAVCRELTKVHEEVARGTLGELARRFRGDVKGEIVLVIAPAASSEHDKDVGFAVDALRHLVQSGARPRAAASRRRRPHRHAGERPLQSADRARGAEIASDAVSSFYVTTPIYYVNAEPHLGHAYSTMAADVLARHHRQRGDDVFFLTGTDEHGEPVENAAKKAGVTPQELADTQRGEVRRDDADRSTPPTTSSSAPATRGTPRRSRRSCSGSTTTAGSRKGVYEGWYCPRCADFKTERELGPGNTCPIHEIPLREGTRGELLLQALRLPGPARRPL